MNSLEAYTDEELLRYMQQGEKGISDYLMEKYKSLVKQLARKMFLIGGETDDLIQEGMIGLFKAIQDYSSDKNASFYTFASLCINRQLYHAIQNSNRKKHQPLNTYISISVQEEDSQTLFPNMESPEEILIHEEEARAMRERILQLLSPMEKQVLKLYLEGYDYNRIAEILGKKPKSVDNAVQRIRAKAREVYS